MVLFKLLTKRIPLVKHMRTAGCCGPKPYHLICFKQWNADMVFEIINSAINLKCKHRDTHCSKLDLLKGCKVMILQEVNEPILTMAVSKAATFLGADDNVVIDHLVWEHDYNGKVFSQMADAIFVSTLTHMCVMRFAEQSTVPVMCMRSRTHASIQSLATMMAVYEEFSGVKGLNFAYLGKAHPVLNSYLLLCPMLLANIKFKCCCNKTKITPLLYKASEEMCETTHTTMKPCDTIDELLNNACVLIAGPTSSNKMTKREFAISEKDLNKNSKCKWIFFHTCPRGQEVGDDLFFHERSRTFDAFLNMQYIAAALMARAIKGWTF